MNITMTTMRSLCRSSAVSGVVILSIIPAMGFSGSYIDVAIGENSLCTVSLDGSPRCQVVDYATRLAVPEGIGQFVSLSAGDTHICGIATDNTVRCWGDNYFNQQQVPVSTAPFIQLDAGRNHTCAVDSNDTAWCWGLDDGHQATPPDDGLGFIQVAAGFLNSCGIRIDGTVDCWGSDDSIRQVPADLGPIIDIDVSYQSACGLSVNGAVQCWGVSARTLAGGPYTDIAVTAYSVCGLQSTGKVICSFGSQSPPSEYLDAVSGDSSFSAIESGLAGTCGILTDGSLKCWGTRLSLSDSAEIIPPPYDLQTFQYSDTMVELTWRSADSVPTYITVGYDIYRDGELLAFTENGSSFMDRTLVPGTGYSYRVAQILFDGRQSDLSEATEAGTSLLPTGVLDLSARLYSPSALELFWRASPTVTEENVDIEFTVKRNGVIAYTGDGRSFFDQGLSPGTRYRYTVEVSNPSLAWAPATITLVTLPPYPLTSSLPSIPAGLSGDVYSRSALELFWDRSEAITGIEVYEISRDGVLVVSLNGTSYFQANLQAGTTYLFDVVAIDIHGQRSIPASVELTTLP